MLDIYWVNRIFYDNDNFVCCPMGAVNTIYKRLIKKMKIPNIHWIGWIKTKPDITKEVAKRTRKELKEMGFIVKQKNWKDFGIISYYTTPQAIKNYQQN